MSGTCKTQEGDGNCVNTFSTKTSKKKEAKAWTGA
jgi:hypothetical protein